MKRARILLVDRHLEMREALVELLEANGYSVTACGSALEALGCLRRGGYDLLVFDDSVPAEGGVDLAAAARDFDQELPVIRLCSDATASVDGADTLLKPFRAEEFLRLVRRGLEIGRLLEGYRELSSKLRQAQEELEALRKELVEAQRLAVVGELGAGGAHELKNLLGIINLSAHYLRTRVEDRDEKALKHLDTIEREVARCNRILMNILSVARPPSHSCEPCDLAAECEEVLGVFEHRIALRGVRIERRYEEGTPPALVDAGELKHVVINLVLNALDAMPEGGELRIEVAPAGERVRLAVLDTGTGIPPDHLEHVFEPFYTTKGRPYGTGLGLCVCRRIVEQAGGTIEVANRPEGGTVVTVLLEAAGRRETSPPQSS